MSKVLKRVSAILLSMAMVSSVFVGCSNDSTSTSSDSV